MRKVCENENIVYRSQCDGAQLPLQNKKSYTKYTCDTGQVPCVSLPLRGHTQHPHFAILQARLGEVRVSLLFKVRSDVLAGVILCHPTCALLGMQRK